MDVSLLVLNAGLLSKGQHGKVTPKEVQALMDVNMYHPTAMLKKFLPKLSKREKQSGIIFVSSLTGLICIPAGSSYSASKAYINYLALAVDYELTATGRTNIDT
jgi:short-subunit dehydrogenase